MLIYWITAIERHIRLSLSWKLTGPRDDARCWKNNFKNSAVPRLKRRAKINVRREYGFCTGCVVVSGGSFRIFLRARLRVNTSQVRLKVKHGREELQSDCCSNRRDELLYASKTAVDRHRVTPPDRQPKSLRDVHVSPRVSHPAVDSKSVRSYSSHTSAATFLVTSQTRLWTWQSNFEPTECL